MGYFLVSNRDHTAIERLTGSPYAELLHRHRKVVVFRNLAVLPRAYFATHAYRDSQGDLERGLFEDGAPMRAAYVHPAPDATGALPEARLLEERWDASRFAFTVDAPEGGLLVVSASWSPDWRAWVDGHPADLVRVNSRIVGVRVPPRGRDVVVDHHSRELTVGLVSFGASGLLLLAYAYARRIRSQPPV